MVEVQRCPLGSGSPRLRSSGGHCDRELAGRRGGDEEEEEEEEEKEEEKEEDDVESFFKIEQPSPGRWGTKHEPSFGTINKNMIICFDAYLKHIISYPLAFLI